MGIYLINLALIVGLKPVLRRIKLENKKKAYVIIVTICLFFVLALRDYSVGVDLRNYVPWYIYWGRNDWGNLWDVRKGIEFGYVLLNKILYTILPSPRFLLVFMGAVQMICYGYAVYKESDDVQFSYIMFITLGIFQAMASGLRQSTAACLLMVAYHYIKEKDLKRFVVMVLSAFIIHKSAIIFLPLYFLYGIRIKLRILSAALILYLVSLLYGSSILKFIITYTGYVRYFSMKYSLSVNGEMGLLVMVSALIIVFLLIYIGDYNIEFSFAMFMLLIMESFIILTFYLGIVARIIKYFTFIATIVVPNLNEGNGNNANRNIIKSVSCFIFFLYYILVLAVSDTSKTFVYKFLWQP